MNFPIQFQTHTALSIGLRELLIQLQQRVQSVEPITVFLAGGMAVHLYTASRSTTDVDAEFSSRIYVPSDLVVDVSLDDGTTEPLYFDTNYNSTFALMHEDYTKDSLLVDMDVPNIELRVLTPVDLAVSKIARFADNDKEDIAGLVRLGLTSSVEIERRAIAAIGGFVGGKGMLLIHLRDAVNLARKIESNL